MLQTCLLLNKTCQSLGLYSRVNLPAILAKTRHSAQRQHSPIVARDYRIGIVDVLTYLGNRRNLSEKLRTSNSLNVLRNSPLIINVHWPLFNSTHSSTVPNRAGHYGVFQRIRCKYLQLIKKLLTVFMTEMFAV